MMSSGNIINVCASVCDAVEFPEKMCVQYAHLDAPMLLLYVLYIMYV